MGRHLSDHCCCYLTESVIEIHSSVWASFKALSKHHEMSTLKYKISVRLKQTGSSEGQRERSFSVLFNVTTCDVSLKNCALLSGHLGFCTEPFIV